MKNQFNTDQMNPQQGGIQKFMGQFMQMPVAGFYYSVELFVTMLQGMQRASEQGVGRFSNGVIKPTGNNISGVAEQSTFKDEKSPHPQSRTKKEEEKKMWDDQDLSGDDLKYVTYSIIFTKPDLETSLTEEKQTVINYSTNGGSFGGLKIAKFMGEVAKGKITRPEIWKENDYPDDAVDDEHWSIPEEDEKYIFFNYRVTRRLDKNTEDYQRDKIRALKGIQSSIDKVGSKIGP